MAEFGDLNRRSPLNPRPPKINVRIKYHSRNAAGSVEIMNELLPN